jgi:hydrogenase-4 membrane subunit HyfE
MLHLVVLIAGASLLLNRRIQYVLIAYVALALTESVFVAKVAVASPLTLALFALATLIKVVLAPAGIALFVRANPAADDLRPSLAMPLRLLLVIGFALVSAAVARFPSLADAAGGPLSDLIAYVLLCGVGMLIVHRNLLSHIIGLLVLGVAIALAGAVLAPSLPEAIELGATFDALVATFIGLAIVRSLAVDDPMLDVDALSRLRG